METPVKSNHSWKYLSKYLSFCGNNVREQTFQWIFQIIYQDLWFSICRFSLKQYYLNFANLELNKLKHKLLEVFSYKMNTFCKNTPNDKILHWNFIIQLMSIIDRVMFGNHIYIKLEINHILCGRYKCPPRARPLRNCLVHILQTYIY